MSDKITVERWWKELCARHGQAAWDPDAFWFKSPSDLRILCDAAKAEFGFEEVEVELPDWY
jgi:hypothetical protein